MLAAIPKPNRGPYSEKCVWPHNREWGLCRQSGWPNGRWSWGVDCHAARQKSAKSV